MTSGWEPTLSSSTFFSASSPPPLPTGNALPSPEELKPFFGVKSWAFIHRMTRALKLGKVVTHTSLVFFHRFFKHQEFHNHDRLLMAATCVYLATKVEEKEKACRLSALVIQYLKLTGLLDDSVDPNNYGKDARAKDIVPDWKNRFIVYERALLYTIGFNLNVEHPFKALSDLMKVIKDNVTPSQAKSFEHRLFFSQACKFLNDSMSQSFIVDADPPYLASMALYLTALLHELAPPKDKSWADVLQIQDQARFVDDCAKAMSMYDSMSFRRLKLVYVPPKPDPSTALGSFSFGGAWTTYG